MGALATTLACAAYASGSLHTALRVVDPLIGPGLIAIALLAVFLLVAVPAGLVRLLLRFAARHTGARAGRILLTPLPWLRFIGHPLTTTTLAVVVVVWASPSAGPLALYHSLWYFEIPIVGLAAAGALGGIAWHALRSGPATRQLVTLSTAIPAIALAFGVGAWSVLPGTGDALVREDAAAVARIPMLDLPDPSAPGPYRLATAAYGSGSDLHRDEFGANVTWRTPSVDASSALPPRDGVSAAYSKWYWGFDSTRLPVNGLVWYPPDAPGRLPLVLIVHGNHDAEECSDPGYGYLAEHLASRGMIAVSVDENYLNGDAWYDYTGAEMGVRAWLLLQHLDQFRTWDADPTHPLAGRVDLQRVALIGHSRGGEAVAVAAMLNRNGVTPWGLSPSPTGFGIKAVIALAPSDTMYSGSGTPVALKDVDYLVIQGAHDGDLPGFDGLRMYHRLTFSGEGGDHLKVALYSQRANHGRFNSVWDVGDAGLPSWMLDRGSMLEMAEQQRLAKTAIGAFLARSLLGETDYDAFFREPRAGRAWLPDDIVETHWQSSGRSVVDDFESVPVLDARHTTSGFTAASSVDPGLRDGLDQRDHAIQLEWAGPAEITFPIDDTAAFGNHQGGSLVFAMAPAVGSATPDPLVEVRSGDGRNASIRLSELASARPSLPTQLWKLPVLGDRYLPQEKHAFPAERFLQTYAVPLDPLLSQAGLQAADLEAIVIRFEGAGSAFLDDVAFEPGVRPSSAAG